MSHHLDSPLARQDPRLDLTDHYVFRGEAGTVFVMNVNSSLSGRDARPGFHPEGRYEIKIHLDGAELEALAYRVTFGEPDEAGEQRLALHLLTGPDARDDAATGELLAQGRTNSPIAGPAGLRLWAGRARDPFYVDVRQVRAINAAVAHGARPDPAGWSPQVAESSFAGSTIHAIVLEVADQDPRLGRDRRIGVWSATKLATDAGGWRQINRAGRPMIWPIFRPDASASASDAGTTSPAEEVRGERERIAGLVAGLVAANGTAADPAAHGAAVAQRLLPDVLPYRTGTPATFGFVEHNGRALADNAPEAMFSLVMNAAVATGLSPREFADTRSGRFPYVVAA